MQSLPGGRERGQTAPVLPNENCHQDEVQAEEQVFGGWSNVDEALDERNERSFEAPNPAEERGDVDAVLAGELPIDKAQTA